MTRARDLADSADKDIAGTITLDAVNASGVITGLTVEATGTTAAGDNAALGYTTAEGLILTGQGSTNDVTIKNDADADVIEIPTGTVNVTMAGTLGVVGEIAAASLDISGAIDVDGTTNLDVVDIDGAVNMATTALVTGVLTTTAATVFNGGFASNANSTIGGTLITTGNLSISETGANNEKSITIANSSVAGGIIGVEGASGNRFSGSAVNNMFMGTTTADGIEFATNNVVRANIASGGDATFNGNVKLPDDRAFIMGANSDFQLYHDPDVNIIQAAVSDQNIRFKINDGGTVRTCLDFNAANGGRAEFQQQTAVQVARFINTVGDSIIQIDANAANKNSIIHFGDGDDADVGKIDYDHNNNTMKFVTNAGVRVNILANGTQEINCTAQNVVNSGTGIINLISNGARQAGLGPFIGFRVPNSTGGTTTEDMGAIGFVSPDATDGNRLADFIITTRNTSVGEKFRIAANGQITATDTSISSNSDSRLKKDIVDYAYDWDTFKTYDVKQFNWKQPQFHMGKTNQIGFIAQDLQSVDSQWVGATPLTPTDEDGNAHVEAQYLDADLVSLTSKLGEKDAMYVSIIQQLISKVETLESKVTVLEG